jgi:dipeptidyl aminopeptidase/acylaminoacyl peptidase
MRKKLRFFGTFLIFLSLILPLGATPRQGEGKRGITPEDYFAFEFAGDPRLSPDGKLVAYVVTSVDQRQNRRHSSIWMTTTDGRRAPWPFTTSPQSSSAPRWSPDGRWLAFLSARPIDPAPRPAAEGAAPSDARAQVYLLSLDGGEARRVTNLKNGVSSFQWSPDGTRLACVSRLGPSDSRASNRDHSDVRHYKTISYKFNDTGWFDDRRNHIWVIDLKTGKEQMVTAGNDWNDSDPQWSPDGLKLAFVSNRTGKEYEDNHDTDVWVIDATGGKPLKISDHPESDNSPRWSPDGKTIAFVGRMREEQHPKIWLAPATGGAVSRLAANDLDLIPTDLDWAEGARSLYFTSGVKGETHLFRVDVASRQVTQVTKGARALHGVDINDKTQKMAYTADDFKHLDDVYIADLSGQNEQQLSHLNGALWRGLALADVERVAYKAADGWDIDGFFVKPLGWQEGKKYPMILSIHGGPAGMYGVDWYHEFQVYAARGWAVFFTNPRGSTGYGEKFENGIIGEWGGKDYTDIMSGVDMILAKYPWIDRDRLGVTGGSYGGFMTNWIVGHTDRFKAAVTLRNVVNFISDEGTRDGAYGHHRDFGGFMFDQFEIYWDRSPLKYAKNVKTPTLILHSDNDYRVPLEQGEQWFRALKHYGVTTELVIFPRENHNLTRTGEPRHLVESLNWQLYWFDRFINGNSAAVPPDAK